MNCLTLLVKVFLPTDSLTYEEGSLLALFCKGKPTMVKAMFSGQGPKHLTFPDAHSSPRHASGL